MKLWEVIKELTEDPTKKFKSKDGWFIKITEEGNLTWIDNNFVGYGVFTVKRGELEDDWHLVRQPVTWQEAIQAWADGKIIRLAMPGWENAWGPNNAVELNQCRIKDGTWYVED